MIKNTLISLACIGSVLGTAAYCELLVSNIEPKEKMEHCVLGKANFPYEEFYCIGNLKYGTIYGKESGITIITNPDGSYMKCSCRR